MKKTAHGVFIPDIPGGDTLEETWKMAIEACHIQLEELVATDAPIPYPSPVSKYANNPDFVGMGIAMLDIDIAPYLGKTEKINATLPAYIIRRIDEYVTKRGIKSRSAFLAEATLDKLAA